MAFWPSGSIHMTTMQHCLHSMMPARDQSQSLRAHPTTLPMRCLRLSHCCPSLYSALSSPQLLSPCRPQGCIMLLALHLGQPRALP